MTNTSASQQLSDFSRDLSNPHNWESGVAMGIGLYMGARSSGMMPKAQTPIRTMPSGAAPLPKTKPPRTYFSDLKNGRGLYGMQGKMVGIIKSIFSMKIVVVGLFFL